MKPSLRPAAETPVNRGGTDAAEPRGHGRNPFGAVLGALRDPTAPSRVAAPAMPGKTGTAGAAEPTGILAVSAAAEPARQAGREVFDALVARAVPERPPVGAGSGTIAVAPAADPPSVDAVEEPAADPDASQADAREAETSAPERLDPASQAGVSLPVPPLAPPAPQRASTDAAAVSAFPNPLPAPPEASAVSEPRMRVTVLRQETHFAPVMPRSVRAPVQAAAPDGIPAASDPFEAGPLVTLPAADTLEPASVDPRVVTAPTPDAVPPHAAGAVPSASAPGLPGETVTAPPADPISQEAGVPEGGIDARGTEARTGAVSAPALALQSQATGGPPVPAAGSLRAAGRDASSADLGASPVPPAMPASVEVAATVAPSVAQQRALASPAPDAPRPAEPVRTSEPARAPAADLGAGPHQPSLAPSATGAVASVERDHGAEAVAPQPAVSSATPMPSAALLSSPAAQIVEAVTAEAQRAAPTLSGVPTAVTGTDGPLRILTLQLRPMDLGNVVVRMRLRGNQLEMSLHASREDTAELLRKDGGLLGALLRDAGYQPDAVTIGAPLPEATSGHAPASGQTFQPGSGGHNPARDMSDQPARRQPGAGAGPTTDTRERTNETSSASPDRSGVYL